MTATTTKALKAAVTRLTHRVEMAEAKYTAAISTLSETISESDNLRRSYERWYAEAKRHEETIKQRDNDIAQLDGKIGNLKRQRDQLQQRAYRAEAQATALADQLYPPRPQFRWEG